MQKHRPLTEYADVIHHMDGKIKTIKASFQTINTALVDV